MIERVRPGRLARRELPDGPEMVSGRTGGGIRSWTSDRASDRPRFWWHQRGSAMRGQPGHPRLSGADAEAGGATVQLVSVVAAPQLR